MKNNIYDNINQKIKLNNLKHFKKKQSIKTNSIFHNNELFKKET